MVTVSEFSIPGPALPLLNLSHIVHITVKKPRLVFLVMSMLSAWLSGNASVPINVATVPVSAWMGDRFRTGKP